MKNAAELVSKAILGTEAKTVVVKGEPYFVKPPTIRKIAGVGAVLSSMEGRTLGDVLSAMRDTEKAAEALSWMIEGNDSMKEVFMDAPFGEVVNALAECMTLIGIEDFQKLSDLSKSVLRLIANQK